MKKPLLAHIRQSFECFARNGCWGTCVDCPRSEHTVYPEFCRYFDRCDHQLGIDELVSMYKLNYKG